MNKPQPPRHEGLPSEQEATAASNKPLYYPSIYRYKCRGGFFASSDDTDTAGVCLGIQTQLQHVRDLHKSTEEESLHLFLQDYVPPQDSSSQTVPSPHSQILEIPAMVYPTTGDSNDTTTTNDNNNDSPLLPLNDKTTKQTDDWHDWSCYGSTEVRLLVLRDIADSHKERTAAVAPNCRMGLSLRDVGNAQGGDTVATMRMGPVEVLLRNQYEVHEEEEMKGGKTQQQHLERRGVDEETKRRDQIVHRNKNIPSSDRSSATTFVKGGQKVFETSKKIVTAMQENATILREAVREDFPQRTWDASQRVAGEFGKTAQRTSSLMKQLYDIWQDDDDE